MDSSKAKKEADKDRKSVLCSELSAAIKRVSIHVQCDSVDKTTESWVWGKGVMCIAFTVQQNRLKTYDCHA